MLLPDPLGPLWPVIGILVEALLLFLIIFIAEKRKKDKEKGKIRRFFFPKRLPNDVNLVFVDVIECTQSEASLI